MKGAAHFSVVAVVLACGDEPRIQTLAYEDVGAVCLSPRAAGGTHVQTVLTDCIPGCFRTKNASCTVDVMGSVLTLTARGTTDIDLDGPCPELCIPLVAQCLVPDVRAGSYELVYGERSTTVAVPVSDPRTEVLPGTVQVCQALMVLK